MAMTFSRLSIVAVATLVVAGAAQGGGVSEIEPFVGDLTETWEGFLNWAENPDFYLNDPAAIMGGHASISNPYHARLRTGGGHFRTGQLR